MIYTESEYDRIVDLPSTKPYHVNIGKGEKVWYYLCHGVDKGKVGNLIRGIHNCMMCTKNVCKISGLFGPNGYALPFPDEMEITSLREQNQRDRGVNVSGTFLVTPDSVKCTTRYDGEDIETGSAYVHLSLNVSQEYMTSGRLARSITPVLLKKLSNGSMDSRLEEIITHMQRVSDEGISDMDMLDVVMKSPKLFQKEFWEYRINFAKRIQRYARRFPKGNNWKAMDPFHKMHVRVFALFYGGSYSHSENLGFKAISQLVDCSKDVYNGGSLVQFMNSRSDPENYMIGMVSRAIEENSVTSRFTVSLAWETTTDLDLWVRTQTGERIGHTNKESKVGKTRLDFDANSVEVSTRPVENITLDDEVLGVYDVYVNNFRTRDGDKTIPYVVIVNLDNEKETYHGTWDCTKVSHNSRLKKMHYVTTVHITRDMINKRKAPEMSYKQSRKFSSILENFQGITGTVISRVVDMNDLGGKRTILLRPESHGRRATMSQRSVHSSFTTISEILRNTRVSLNINARDFPPTVLTTHNCSEKVLKTSIVPNTYYERGKAPKQPNVNKKYELCRIDNDWCSVTRPRIMSVIRLQGSTYNGVFCSVEKPKFPQRSNRDWVIGSGMYPSDLKIEYHKFRDIWHAYHTNVYPILPKGDRIEMAVGVFLHSGQTIRVFVNGNETNIKIDV